MSLARLVVTAVEDRGTDEGRGHRATTGSSPRWVYELVRRFDAEGESGLEPRSRQSASEPGPHLGAI